jgi:O-antigen ligase
VFGGVHVHFQQLAIAFPAMMYVSTRFPLVRGLAGGGIALAMIPWNVVSSNALAGLAPLLVGVFCAQTIGRKRGLMFAGIAAAIMLSVLGLAVMGFGPPTVHFVPHAYPLMHLPNGAGAISHARSWRGRR